MKKILLFAVGALAATAAFAQPKLTADNIDEIIQYVHADFVKTFSKCFSIAKYLNLY